MDGRKCFYFHNSYQNMTQDSNSRRGKKNHFLGRRGSLKGEALRVKVE